jgi:hypothetical protein
LKRSAQTIRLSAVQEMPSAMSGTSSRSGERPKYRLNFATAWMEERCIAGDRLQIVMFSIMRRRRELVSAIGVLLSARMSFDNAQSFRQERSYANTALPIPR